MSVRAAARWVVLAAVLARLLFLAAAPPPGGRPEAVDESAAAANLIAGRGFVFEQYGATYHAFKEPLYIVLLAGVMAASRDAAWALWLFQSVWGALAALLVFAIARRLYRDSRRPLAAGCLAALNPFLVYYDLRIVYPLSFHCVLLLLIAWTVLDAARPAAHSRAVRHAGMAMGLALWQRGIYLAAGFGAWFGAFLAAAASRARLLGKAAGWALIAIALISPWLARNARLTGRAVMTTESAHVFWMGNTDQPNDVALEGGRRWVRTADPEFARRVHAASEGGQYQLFLDDALRSIRQDPRRFGWACLERLRAFFWFSPTPGAVYTAMEKTVYRAWYAALLALGLAGFARYWRRTDVAGRRQMLILAGAVAGLAAAHALFLMNQKYRVPWELVLTIFAVGLLKPGVLPAPHRPRAVARPRPGASGAARDRAAHQGGDGHVARGDACDASGVTPGQAPCR